MKVKRVIRKEELISRLPALFAYIEDNALGDSELHSAYDSKIGCYGKVVENIMLPEEISYSENGVWAEVDGETLLQRGTIHSYRTIMNCYYNYHDSLNSVFLEFVDRAIGRIKVSFDDYTTDMDLVPTYVYLATVNNLYDEMVKMYKHCQFYNWRKEQDGEDAYMCCLCDKFERMGGESMIKFLEGYLLEAETRANEYLVYAQNAHEIKPISVTIPIQLTSTNNDLGILAPYISQWVAGNTYFNGDKVYYDGNIYTCEITEIDLSTGELKKYTSGYYNSDTELIEFDSANWVADPLVDYTEDNTEEDTDEEPDEGTEDDTIEGFTESQLKGLRRYTSYINEYGTEERPTSGTDWLFYYRKGEIINIETLNDDFGNIIRYKLETDKNTYNEVEDPYNNEPDPFNGKTDINNLFAYGDVLYDITANEKENSITFTYYIGVHLTATYVGSDADDDGNRHYYFSDFQADINEENQRHVVKHDETYYYETDGDIADLVATKVTIDDGNGGKNEVTAFDLYVNGYYDYGGDVYKEFDGLVIGSDDYNDLVDKIATIGTTKYEFNTTNNVVYFTKQVGPYSIDRETNIANFETTLETKRDMQTTPNYKLDYYSGISYAPTDEIDVYISRGDTTAFEKFIKFSEVKTIFAMERYSNGSFFTMKSDT